MYDHRFERTVRQKMDGLEFSPSGSIWSNIDRTIAGQRRRVGMVFLARMALPLLLLAGAAGAFFFAARERAGIVEIPGSRMPAVPEGVRSAVSAAGGAHTSAAGGAHTSAAGGAEEFDPKKVAGYAVRTAKHTQTLRELPDVAGEEKENLQISGKQDIGDASAIPAVWIYTPDLSMLRQGVQVQAGKLVTKKANVAVNTIQKVRRPWEAGFSGGGGYSRLNTVSVPSAPLSNSALFGLPSYSSSNNAGKHFISDVRPGASFYAGIQLQKPVAARLAIVLGMDLHFYSNRITTGQQVVTYVPASASGITPTVAPAALQATPLYVPGDEHVVTNKYYFLEAPVGLQWRVNRSPMLPLFLKGGASLARLMGSNAMFYDPHSGVYLRDDQVVEKTELNLFASLMVGLPFHGVRIQAGPEAEYGLTPLINNVAFGSQHLFYGGIRLVVLPSHK
jgi:hypothetical protein